MHSHKTTTNAAPRRKAKRRSKCPGGECDVMNKKTYTNHRKISIHHRADIIKI